MGDSYCQRKERKMAKYKFKGYTITNCGYHQPDHCVWWEAVDENGEACFHGNTLREVEFMILDYEWEQKMRKKEEEIELLKASKPSGNAAEMREALVRVKRLFDGRLMWQPDIRKAHEAVNAALSSPPRNCDRLSADQCKKMFEHEMGIHLPKEATDRDRDIVRLTAYGVIDALYAERKGEGDGK